MRGPGSYYLALLSSLVYYTMAQGSARIPSVSLVFDQQKEEMGRKRCVLSFKETSQRLLILFLFHGENLAVKKRERSFLTGLLKEKGRLDTG